MFKNADVSEISCSMFHERVNNFPIKCLGLVFMLPLVTCSALNATHPSRMSRPYLKKLDMSAR